MSVIINSIFLSGEYNSYTFGWDDLTERRGKFSKLYEHLDAKAFLQLCFNIGHSNELNEVNKNPKNVIDKILSLPLCHKAVGVKFPGWLTVKPLIYNHCPLKSISNGLRNSCINERAIMGYVLFDKKHNTTIVAFCATSNTCMALMDLDYKQTEMKGVENYVIGSKCSSGVYKGYLSVRNDIIETLSDIYSRSNSMNLFIMGHSLGGSLSQLCAYDMAFFEPTVYTYGAPRIFNEKAYKIYTRNVRVSHRIHNICDIVTLGPLPLMGKDKFYHVGDSTWFQRNLDSYIQNHTLAYIEEFDSKEKILKCNKK